MLDARAARTRTTQHSSVSHSSWVRGGISAALAVSAARSDSLRRSMRNARSSMPRRNATSQHSRVAQRYAPRPERFPVRSRLTVPSGLRTSRSNARFPSTTRHAIHVRRGTCRAGAPAPAGELRFTSPPASCSQAHSDAPLRAYSPIICSGLSRKMRNARLVARMITVEPGTTCSSGPYDCES